jgi:predicted acetyltransferase
MPGKNQGMAAAYPIRPISEEEFGAFYAVIERAFNSSYPTDEELRYDLRVFEFDRSLAAFDKTEIVGTAASLSLQMTVPGGTAAVAGVTAVTTAPSHRRRGILTSLMHRQLTDIRDRGESVAALFASEAGIYGRYGYAPATAELQLTIRRGEGVLSALAERAVAVGRAALRPRTAEPQDARADLAKVFDRVLHDRPGMQVRDDRWWDQMLWDPDHRRSGGGPLRCVIAEDGEGPRGYALFSVRPEWDDGIPNGMLRVRELMAVDPVAYWAVWSDLLNRDLVGEVHAWSRPADEPLCYLLADQRRARPRLVDGLWVRLVSVPGALAVRRYSCPVDVVIEVADDLLPENAGRWRLRAPGPAADGGSAAAEPATCERTTATADVTLPVQALGATYLGGISLGALAAAGLVEASRPGSLTALSAALSWELAPWSPTHY